MVDSMFLAIFLKKSYAIILFIHISETSNRQTYIIIGVVSGLVLITIFVGICICVACRRGPAVQRLVAYPPAPPIIYPGPRIRPLRALRFNAARPRLQFA